MKPEITKKQFLEALKKQDCTYYGESEIPDVLYENVEKILNLQRGNFKVCELEDALINIKSYEEYFDIAVSGSCLMECESDCKPSKEYIQGDVLHSCFVDIKDDLHSEILKIVVHDDFDELIIKCN